MDKQLVFTDTLETPLGTLTIAVDHGGRLEAIEFPNRPLQGQCDPGRCSAVRRQLEEYFRGQRQKFNLPLAPSGTAFQQRVWRALQDIPYGQTESYGDLARRLGKPKASRAVGSANGANPIPIVIPCHRVIASNGGLGGYAGGLALKRQLLKLEGALEQPELSLGTIAAKAAPTHRHL